jgi:hypothetical protein
MPRVPDHRIRPLRERRYPPLSTAARRWQAVWMTAGAAAI